MRLQLQSSWPFAQALCVLEILLYMLFYQDTCKPQFSALCMCTHAKPLTGKTYMCVSI